MIILGIPGPILLLLAATVIHAQTPSMQNSRPLEEGTARQVGLSEERLSRIDMMAQQAIAEGKVPGMVALVARRGRIVYHKAFGMADPASGRLMDKDAIFRIASQTKAITATAVMMLWEEGRFGLDDPISDYIPEFKNPRVLATFNDGDASYTTIPAKSEISIRQLLTHSSGLGYGFIDSDQRMKRLYREAGIVDAWTTRDMLLDANIKRLAALPLHFHPGERYKYSEGLDVLGYLVEIVSGMSLQDYFLERIFKPLGMNDTYFYLPETKEERLVPVQKPVDGGWEKYQGSDYYDADYPVKGARSYFSGGAGLVSTAEDYAAFLQMYLNGGELNGVRLLSRTTVDTIMAHQVDDPVLKASYLGLCFNVTDERAASRGGLGSDGTFSWGGYFNTSYFADPEEQIVGILLKQTAMQLEDDTGTVFRRLVFQAVDD